MVVLFAWCSASDWARADTAWQQYQERRWEVADGLPQSTVRAVEQTSDGFVWVATEGGVARFDGAEFTPLKSPVDPNLRFRRAHMLLSDSAQQLWIGLNGGAGLARLSHGRLEPMNQHLPSWANAVISGHEDASGRLWFGTWWGLAVQEPSGYVLKRNDSKGVIIGGVWAISEYPLGTIWFGTTTGLFRYQPAHSAQGIERFDLGPDARGVQIRALTSTGKQVDSLWVGTEGAGLFEIKHDRARRYAAAEGLPSDTIRALLVARDGTLWVGTKHGGTRLVNGRFQNSERRSGTAQDVIAFAEDREGNMWLGTRGGLVLLTRSRFTQLATPAVVNDHGATDVVSARDGTIWIGTDGGGLAWIRGGESGVLSPADGLCSAIVSALWEDRKGNIWVGGESEKANLCRIDAKDHRTITIVNGLPSGDIVRTFAETRGGGLLVGTSSGIHSVTEEGVAIENQPSPGARPHDGVWSIHEDSRGWLWAGAESGLRSRRNGRWTAFGKVDGLPSAMVFSMYEDSAANLWFGTMEGLGKFSQGKFRGYTALQGLPDDPVNAVLEDGKENLWLCTARGVWRVAKRDLDGLDSGRLKTVSPARYDAADGMGIDPCAKERGGSGRWKDAAGRLTFPTSQGVVSIDPDTIVGRSSPEILIETASLDGRTLLGPDKTLAANRGELQIRYTAPIFTGPEKVQFQYRLEPFDSQYVQAGQRRFAHYAALSPGSYRFLVSVKNTDGVWSRSPAALSFTLLPRFYQRRSFFVLVGLSLLMFGWLVAQVIHRLRLDRLRSEHRAVLNERGRMARDLHDTLAQGLTVISVQLENAVMRWDATPEKARESLDEARAMVRTSLSDARSAVWNIRQATLAGADLVTAIAEQVKRAGSGVPIRFRTHGTVRRLGVAQEESLVRIAQEALTNAVRHAKAGTVVVELFFDQNGTQLDIVDDGVGFSPGETPGHFGVQGMQERANAAGIELTVQANPGQGTRITARLAAGQGTHP